jgi:two-component system, cell cycle response regulator DivK
MSARILLVEDNATNRYLATYLLEQQGYSVSHAADGEEALTAAASERPDVILMDIQMPKMDGYEAARRIKEKDELRHIPLIALTSYAMAGDRQRAMESGFAGYIEKPIATETFAAEVEKHLKP